MICTRCGKNNPEGVRYCAYCGQPIGLVPGQAPPGAGPPLEPQAPTVARMSGAAIASIVLGVLGFCTAGIAGVAGLIAGAIALGQIRASGGRITGTPAAAVGIVLSSLTLLMIPIYWAIIYPVIRQQSSHSQQTLCLSNGKQLSLAALMYSQDWDERYMLKSNWCDAVMPYVKNPEVYRCPVIPTSASGYGCNSALESTKAAQVSAPASAVMLFETHGGWNVSGGSEAAVARHADRLNIGFLDGHVKAMPLAQAQQPAGIVWDPKATPSPVSPAGPPY